MQKPILFVLLLLLLNVEGTKYVLSLNCENLMCIDIADRLGGCESDMS